MNAIRNNNDENIPLLCWHFSSQVFTTRKDVYEVDIISALMGNYYFS